jgi:hypothetical protein
MSLLHDPPMMTYTPHFSKINFDLAGTTRPKGLGKMVAIMFLGPERAVHPCSTMV